MSEAAVIEPGTGLALVGNISLPSAFIAQEVTDVLAKVKAAAKERAAELDISTKKGREGIASLAYKISLTKTAMDDHGKSLVADLKAQTGLIDAERRRVRDELDALKAEVRKPLTDYEEAEKERIRLHECALLEIQDVRKTGSAAGLTSTAIAEAIAALEPYKARDWQEFAKRAETALSIAAEDLEFRHKAALKAEAEALELAQLHAAEVERQRVAREKQIADEAAAKAKREAEERAEAEKQAAADALRRQQEEAERAKEAARVAEERIEAERVRYHEACLSSVAGMISDACSPFNSADKIRYITEIFDGMEEHKRDWQEFAERYASIMVEGRKRIADRLAEVEQRDAERAEKARQEQEAQAKRDQEAAIEAERQRVADIQVAEERERQRREANKAHRAKINRAALAALVHEGIPEEWAKAAIEAIAHGKVPAISIAY